MAKLKVGVILGGMSTENEVSCTSALSVINNLDTEKYDIDRIYIDKQGNWYSTLDVGMTTKPIEDIFTYLKSLDVIFPVLHGLYGEDGTIQ